MNRSLVLLSILVAVLVTVVWWLVFINPRNDAVDAAEDALAFEQLQEQTLQGRITELRDILEEEFSYVTAIEEIEASIPVEAMLDAVIEDIQAVAEDTGVTLIAIATTPPTFDALQPDQELFEIDLTLSLEGQYFEVLGFVIGLEDMDRLVRVDTLTMAPAQSEQVVATTTTSTTSPTDTTSSTTTTTTTTTTAPSIEEDLLSVSIRAKLFTRSPLTDGAPEEPTE